MKRDHNIKEEFDGYAEIKAELEIRKKTAKDINVYKGQTAKIIDLYHPKKLSLKLDRIFKETTSAKTFRFVSANNYFPPFQAGQYINLHVEIDGVLTSRPYSIASSPSQTGYIDITVRRVENGFVSNYLLDESKMGDAFISTSPAGQFHYNPVFHGDDLVFLAGGSGITPFMSMIREVTDGGLNREIHLIYGCRDVDDIIYKDELEKLSHMYGNLKVSIVISEPPENYDGLTGFITAELLKDLLDNINDKTFYLCGPKLMYDFCKSELESMNIPRRKVRTEVMQNNENVTAQAGWPEEVSADADVNVTVNGSNTFSAKAGEPLLNSLERNGFVVPCQCRSGECSICRVKLSSGRVFMPTTTKIRQSDRKYNFIHSCAAFPVEDIEISM